MNRPRKTDRHLPANMYFKHGAYYWVKGGKWHRLGVDLATSLAEYGRLLETPKGGMADLIDDALAAHQKKKPLAPSTVEQYTIAAGVLKRKLAQFSPEQVRGKHVAALKQSLAATPNMANRILSFLKTVFGYAVEWQLVDSNPCIGITRYDEAKRARYVTDDEYARIYAKAGPRLQVIMDLLYLTGQRITDVLALRLSDLTDDGIVFKPKKTKNSTQIRLCVRWTPELRATVERAKKLSAVPALTLMRGRTGKAPDYGTVFDQFIEACTAAELDDTTPHDLRAKSLTDAKRQGLDPQALAGHSTPAMTERYIRLRETPQVSGPSFRRPIDAQKKG